MTGSGKYIFILVGLIGISMALALTKGGQRTSSFDRDLFQVSDTAAIERIQIEQVDESIVVLKTDKGWTVRDSLKADESLVQVLGAILSQVQVVRPVSQINLEDIRKDMMEKGSKVEIGMAGQTRKFYTGGNTSKSQAYFADETLEDIYIVGIPGYNNYLSGIFELSANQWRDRVLFDSDFRTLKLWRINYLADEKTDLELYFEGREIKVRGIVDADSATVNNYVSDLSGFQVNDYLDAGQFPRYDSLLSVQHLAILEIKDIDANKNHQLKLYPKIAGERFYMLESAKNDRIVIDEKRIEKLLKEPQSFATK